MRRVERTFCTVRVRLRKQQALIAKETTLSDVIPAAYVIHAAIVRKRLRDACLG